MQRRARVFLGQLSCGRDHRFRQPVRERRLPERMLAAARVRLAHPGETIGRELLRETGERRPESLVHERNFSVDEAAYEHFGRIADATRQ